MYAYLPPPILIDALRLTRGVQIGLLLLLERFQPLLQGGPVLLDGRLKGMLLFLGLLRHLYQVLEHRLHLCVQSVKRRVER